MDKSFRILIAENSEHLAKQAQEFLESRGYAVFVAETPEAAANFLENTWVHLAVVDLRLRDNDSRIDKSGLELLKTAARQVPKLMWTAYPEDYQDVVEAMKPDNYPLPPAVNFVAKKAGLPELGAAVEEALAQYMPINKKLRVKWRTFLSFSQLTEMIFEGDGRSQNHNLVAELEDLFRLLFRNQSNFEIVQITIGSVIISGNGYIILGLHAFKEDGTEVPYVVTFGKPGTVKKEARLFDTTVPRPIQTSNLSMRETVETTHFAATAYRLVKGHLDSIVSFSRFYYQNDLPNLEKSLGNLFLGNLARWYKQARTVKPVDVLGTFYKAIYQTETEEAYLDWLHKALDQICHKMQSVGFGRATINDQYLRITSPLSEPLTLSSPSALLKRKPTLSEPIQWGRIHGQVGTKTILVDHTAHTWLIDFTQVSEGPLIHDFTYLETQIKTRLLDSLDLKTLHEFERCLINDAVPTESSKAAELIRALRHHASHVTNCTPELYLLGLYYQGLAHLLSFDEARFYTQVELQPYVHLLLSTSLIASTFSEKEAAKYSLPEMASSGVFIDEQKRQVYIDGQLVTNLSNREYKLLVFFKTHEGQTRSRREIVLEGFQEDNYNEFTDPDRVNNVITRLRKKIEPQPQTPQYIVTVPGQGYQFVSSLIDDR